MALDPLAVAADLTKRGVDVTNTDAVAVALAAASASVRDAAGSAISEVTSTVVLQAPECSGWLDLPGGPVSAVDTVLIGAVDVSADVVLRERSLYLSAGWQRGLYPYDEITVTYTHGLVEVPADIIDLVCALAAASLAAGGDYAAQTNIATEAIDDYRVGFVTGEDAAASVVEIPERTRRRLAARFGGGAYVTTSKR